MESWEYSDIVSSRIGKPLTHEEKRLGELMQAEYEARHQEPTKEESRYLGLDW